MSIFKQLISTIPSLSRDGGKRESIELQNVLRDVLPKHRSHTCLHHRLGGSSSVVISATEKGTRLGGVMVCGAAHICPVCHQRKMAQEQKINSKIVLEHYESGGIMVDAVLTVPHHAHETLECCSARLEAVWNEFHRNKNWRALSRQLGIVGVIRRLEVTVGENGWHPHYHVSFLSDPGAAQEIKGHSWNSTLADAFAIVSGHWVSAGREAGISVAEHAQAAVAIIGHVDAQKAVAYNTKNMGYCVKENSLTPFDLLRIVAQVKDEEIVRAAKGLFVKYEKNIKGKHIVTYSGTAKKAKAEISERAKSESAPEVKVEPLGKLSGEAWRAVIKAGLRSSVACVKNRLELIAAVLAAARFIGSEKIPIGWLELIFETKNVMGSSEVVVSST